MKGISSWIVVFGIFILGLAVVFAANVGLIYLSWNLFLPAIFGLKELGLKEAFGLFLLELVIIGAYKMSQKDSFSIKPKM